MLFSLLNFLLLYYGQYQALGETQFWASDIALEIFAQIEEQDIVIDSFYQPNEFSLSSDPYPINNKLHFFQACPPLFSQCFLSQHKTNILRC
ncbi:MAG: hypothetical protein ACP5Q3_05380 [bacterium]